MSWNNVIPAWMLVPSEAQPTRQRAADWHGVQAIKAYRRRDHEAYVRHAKIADSIWSEVK